MIALVAAILPVHLDKLNTLSIGFEQDYLLEYLWQASVNRIVHLNGAGNQDLSSSRCKCDPVTRLQKRKQSTEINIILFVFVVINCDYFYI